MEHILVQLLVQFFNVGEHNNIRLEDADWNDGLDMAPERGESVAFTALYAGNLDALADVLETGRERFGWTEFSVAEEILLLVDRAGKRVDYGAVSEKNRRLKDYFEVVSASLSGKQASLVARLLANRLVGAPRASAMLAGYLLVLLGLFIIARGVSRRLQHAAKHAPPS